MDFVINKLQHKVLPKDISATNAWILCFVPFVSPVIKHVPDT